ncbi:hypothetical protein [Streptomyces sp. 900105245]
MAAKNHNDPPGRRPQTSASSDPAELPPNLTNPLDHEIWTDPPGKRIPVTQLSSHRGAEHCERHSAHFQTMGNGQDTKLHARAPPPLPGGRPAPPPAGTHDTGHRFKHRQPWLTHPKTKAYIRTTDRAEGRAETRPQAKTGTTCT